MIDIATETPSKRANCIFCSRIIFSIQQSVNGNHKKLCADCHISAFQICIVDDNAKAKAPKYEDLTLNLMVLRYRYVNEPESTITLNFKRTNTHALLNINMERCMG